MSATHRYRTEVEVAADGHLILHLPAGFPRGRAWIEVESEAAAGPMPPVVEGLAEAEADTSLNAEIEWWDEFGESDTTEWRGGLFVRE